MKLNQLFGSVPAIEIGGLAIDSRKVKPGDMYFCLEGMVNDGHAFAADAVKAGAVCIVHAKDLDEMPEGAVYVKVGDEVIIMGSDGKHTILADDIANATGTINYEITCAFGQRLPKVYVK